MIETKRKTERLVVMPVAVLCLAAVTVGCIVKKREE